MEPIISFKNFTFRYKSQSKPTLQNITLDIYPGEKVLILGPSGSGKTTLANCINGLVPFSYTGEVSGSCTVNGKETRDLSIFALSRWVGTVLQDTDAQFVGLSVGEDIAFSMENDNRPRKEMRPQVRLQAAMVGMENFLKSLPFDLSGGQKQKVSLAGVVNEHVNILLFDEPLASLDPQMGMTAVDLIDQIVRQKSHTCIIIEHRLEDMLYRPLDRVVLISEGRVAADIKPDDLLKSSFLAAHGIREPLYITFMKYAGCHLPDIPRLSDVNEMPLSQGNREKLLAFAALPMEAPMKTPGEPVLEAQNITFAYPGTGNVLKDVSFTINKGERIAIIGRNGAGKSTMARLICGISRSRQGKILINGKDHAGLSIKEIGERVGYVMQNPNQMLVKDIIKDEVALALTLRILPEEQVNDCVKKALDACRLYPMRNWPVDAVSYGQKKRVTVASVLALGPDVIILDEPTAGQDYRHYKEIMDFINTLNREYGKTILFITHDMHLAIENTERAIVFTDGEIIADDNVYAVLSNDDIVNKASLKQTSLYTLARRLGLEPEKVIRHFIEYERMVESLQGAEEGMVEARG
jgi:energy-coupling factor transport system ATP-binding protein